MFKPLALAVGLKGLKQYLEWDNPEVCILVLVIPTGIDLQSVEYKDLKICALLAEVSSQSYFPTPINVPVFTLFFI